MVVGTGASSERVKGLEKRVEALESEILILRSEAGRLQNSMWRMQGHSNPVNVNPYEVKGRIRR